MKPVSKTTQMLLQVYHISNVKRILQVLFFYLIYLEDPSLTPYGCNQIVWVKKQRKLHNNHKFIMQKFLYIYIYSELLEEEKNIFGLFRYV